MASETLVGRIGKDTSMKFYHTLIGEYDDEIEFEVDMQYDVYDGDIGDVLICSTNPPANKRQLNLLYTEAWLEADRDFRERREEEYLRRKER